MKIYKIQKIDRDIEIDASNTIATNKMPVIKGKVIKYTKKKAIIKLNKESKTMLNQETMDIYL